MSKHQYNHIIRWLCYTLIISAYLWRMREIVLHNPLDHLFSDPKRHWDHAKDALGNSPMVLFDPPLFQIWLSLIQKWSLEVRELVAFYAIMLSLLTPYVWYRCFRELFNSLELALIGWAILGLLPSWINIFSYFMSETLFLPLFGISIWQTLRAKRLKTLKVFALMVSMWTLTALTRGIAAPLAAVAGLWAWWDHQQKLYTALISIIVIAILIIPFAVRNHTHVGLWSPFGNGWLNEIYAASSKKDFILHLYRDGGEWAYIFGSPSLYTLQYQPLTNWSPTREGTVEIKIDLRKGASDWENEYQRNAVNYNERWRLRGENFLLVMAGQSWPDNNTEYFMGRASIASRWLWIPLLLGLTIVAVWRYRYILQQPLIPLLILVWLLVQSISLLAINEGRYRKPMEGLLITQALLFFDLSKRRNHQKPLINLCY